MTILDNNVNIIINIEIILGNIPLFFVSQVKYANIGENSENISHPIIKLLPYTLFVNSATM